MQLTVQSDHCAFIDILLLRSLQQSGEVLNGADHLRNVGVLVVVPGDDLHLSHAAGQLSSISLSVDGDLLAIDNDVVLAGLDSVSTEGLSVSTLSGVILQQVGKHCGAGQVVDSDNLIESSNFIF